MRADHSNLREHHDRMWAALPEDVKAEALALVRALPEAFLAQVREAYLKDPSGWMIGGHFFVGMGVRNYLRSGKWGEHDSGLPGIRDDRLPSGNWDDYYTCALEHGAGARG